MFVFSLASHLNKTEAEILDSMGAIEMYRWNLYFRQTKEDSEKPEEPDWSDPETVSEVFGT